MNNTNFLLQPQPAELPAAASEQDKQDIQRGRHILKAMMARQRHQVPYPVFTKTLD